MGPPKGYKQFNWKVKAEANTAGSGTYVTLIYDVEYAFYDARKTFIVFKPASVNQATVLGHLIRSKGLLK